MLSLASSTIKLAASILHQATSSSARINLNLPEYSLDQVSWHDQDDDCWIVLYDYVYDVTKFIQEVSSFFRPLLEAPIQPSVYAPLQHPGGYDIMMEQAGRDATVAFRSVGHSKAATDDLVQYLVGVLPAKERMYSKNF